MVDDPELSLLLIRPSISKIFESPPDNSLIDADGIFTCSGLYDIKGKNNHVIERLPILSISESGKVSYMNTMRLDLILCLGDLARHSNPPIDFPLGLFTNRDVIVVAQGLYSAWLGYKDILNGVQALVHLNYGEFLTSRIIYTATTVDEGMMINLRRLEATAKHLLDHLTPESTTLPKLPTEIASGWHEYFLDTTFKRAKKQNNNPTLT